jgi:hypothetical protein
MNKKQLNEKLKTEYPKADLYLKECRGYECMKYRILHKKMGTRGNTIMGWGKTWLKAYNDFKRGQ